VAASSPIVDARALVKSYAGRRVVDGVTFQVRSGECLGLLGPNGAGKTTIIKMVTCFAAADGGGLDVLGLPVLPANHPRIKARLGIMQQDDSLDPDLSVEKNLTVFASYFGIPAHEAAERSVELMAFAELAERRNERIRNLSGGMRRRLMLARALLNAPALLVLDEPTTGLDPQARRLVWERVRSLKRRGTTILLTTHYMEEAAQLCDRLIIIDRGRIVDEGTPDGLVARHVGSEVIEVYAPEDTVATRLAAGPWRSERVGDVLYLYLRDGQAPSLEALDGLQFARRRATLEDVFLSLTGHALRD
jgi:lipooligosaccharide transport system ATP-binding protein